MSKRTIHYDLTLSRLLIEPFPLLIEHLARHPVVGENGAQLKLICAVQDVAMRGDVIAALLADNELSADEALVQCGLSRAATGATPLPHMKHVNAVVGNIARLSATLQKRHLPEFVAAFKTDDVKRQLRDLLNAELGE